MGKDQPSHYFIWGGDALHMMVAQATAWAHKRHITM